MPRDFITSESTSPNALPSSGQNWWRSLEEMSDTPEFREYLYREFPENADAWLGGSRRDFLRLMGASLTLAGLSGYDIRQPKETIVPVVKQAGHLPNGICFVESDFKMWKWYKICARDWQSFLLSKRQVQDAFFVEFFYCYDSCHY